ncbi:hypothetical protein PQX77_010301 [Marasmius sp. AFHP31]|nr:hypothetical protein PQX77_010301 [Marasmius sp. AFHP31]
MVILWTLLLFAFTTSAFTVTAPDSPYVDEQFLLNWTWLTSESKFIVLVLNDVSKAPDCPIDTSKREGSLVILNLENRAGSVGFHIDHPGTFQACAFTYHDQSGPATPVNNVISNIAKSKPFNGIVLATTITVDPSSSPTTSPQSFETTGRKSIAGPVIGGSIGGIVLLFLAVWLILFKIKNYRVIRLPPDSPSQSSHSTDSLPVDMRNIHPGVSPFPHPSYMPKSLKSSSAKSRQWPNTMAESALSGFGASGHGVVFDKRTTQRDFPRSKWSEPSG